VGIEMNPFDWNYFYFDSGGLAKKCSVLDANALVAELLLDLALTEVNDFVATTSTMHNKCTLSSSCYTLGGTGGTIKIGLA
jgi:hypothetical protein